MKWNEARGEILEEMKALSCKVLDLFKESGSSPETTLSTVMFMVAHAFKCHHDREKYIDFMDSCRDGYAQALWDDSP